MTQSMLSTATQLLEFLEVEQWLMSHIYTERDRGRRIKRATATLAGGRLHNRLFDCMQRVYAPTPHYAMSKRLWLLQQQSLHRRRSVGEDISAAS